jgi:hypothetical protein
MSMTQQNQSQSYKNHPNNPSNQPFNLPESAIKKTDKMKSAIQNNGKQKREESK